MSMQNCHDDVVAFHNEKVTLPDGTLGDTCHQCQEIEDQERHRRNGS